MPRLWTFLNSGLGVWFLTSVVVGGFTYLFSRYQKSSKEESRKAEIRNRLNLEISTRIAEGLIALRLDSKRLEKGTDYWVTYIYNEAINYLDNRVTYELENKTLTPDFSIYPEYKQRSFRSLTFELGALADESMFPTLREGRAIYKRLVELADEVNQTTLDKDAARAAFKTSIEMLERLQANSFWQQPL